MVKEYNLLELTLGGVGLCTYIGISIYNYMQSRKQDREQDINRGAEEYHPL